jgi:hypothetical protein
MKLSTLKCSEVIRRLKDISRTIQNEDDKRFLNHLVLFLGYSGRIESDIPSTTPNENPCVEVDLPPYGYGRKNWDNWKKVDGISPVGYLPDVEKSEVRYLPTIHDCPKVLEVKD